MTASYADLTTDTGTHTDAIAPQSVAIPAPVATTRAVSIATDGNGDAARRLALARAVLPQGEAATVAAATPETKAKIAAVIHAAGA